jgi:DNA-binding CsgD family transcriptional regulator
MKPNHRREWYRSRNPTRRELEVLAFMLAFGRKVTAHRLGISERTVVHHLTSLYGRLSVDNAPQAALHLGWLSIPPDHMTADVGVHSALRSASAVDADKLAEAVVHYVDARLRSA